MFSDFHANLSIIRERREADVREDRGVGRTGAERNKNRYFSMLMTRNRGPGNKHYKIRITPLKRFF